ncbi:MAG: hypothetical protein ACE5HX_15875 [bacterium]
MTSREKLLIALAATAAVGYILVVLIISPLLNDWQETRTKLVNFKAQYIHTLKLVRMAEKIDDQNLVESEKLPDNNPIAAFLRDIEAATGGLVVIRRFQPLRSSLEGKHTNSTKSGRINITSLQVQIDCLGTLPNLLAFFERIEQKDGLTRIRHFYLTPESRGEDRLHCQLIIVRLMNT